jgi:hypothetical protein
MDRWSAEDALSFEPSAIKRSGRGPPGREAIVRTGVDARTEAVLLAEIGAVLPADVPALRGAVVRPTDQLAEGHAEIATAREWAERTLPPGRWLGGSHCGRDV